MDWPLPDQKFYWLIGAEIQPSPPSWRRYGAHFIPQWNFAFDDADFHGCKPDSPIKIEAIVTDFPDEFRNLNRFGGHLCGWNRQEKKRTDEPGDGLEDALWVRLTVGDDLEPSWRIVKGDDDEGREFRTNDRLKLAVSLIGSYSDRHLTWSKGSITQSIDGSREHFICAHRRVTSCEGCPGGAARAGPRPVRQSRRNSRNNGQKFGSSRQSALKAHLDVDAVNVKLGGLALHEGDMPLRQLGLGSRRMLTSSLQKQALKCPHVTLFDEIEFGLEPHRIARLLKYLKEDASGTYF